MLLYYMPRVIKDKSAISFYSHSNMLSIVIRTLQKEIRSNVCISNHLPVILKFNMQPYSVKLKHFLHLIPEIFPLILSKHKQILTMMCVF